MSYEKLLSDFDERFREIQRKTTTLLNEANQMIVLCTKTLESLRKIVSSEGFKTKDAEIDFFKRIKVVPMHLLIHYTEIRSCELRMPKIGELNQSEFLEKQVDKVNDFFGVHTEFLVYLDQGYKHFDKHYFTRKHLNDVPLVKSYPYYKDAMFNTSHDGILARIRGFGLFIKYLQEKKRQLEKRNSCEEKSRGQGSLIWTGSYAGFVEMVYGCVAAECFNDGNIDIKKVIEELGDFLNIERGNSTRTYNELKNRTQSQIKFFEETGRKLLEKMSKEDGYSSDS